ncbi:unnamed protein product, partial [Musa hybrid cultivar]
KLYHLFGSACHFRFDNNVFHSFKSHTQEEVTIAQATKYEYLKGKILDVFPDYRKEAAAHLLKALCNNEDFHVDIMNLKVRLYAWLCLGRKGICHQQKTALL